MTTIPVRVSPRPRRTQPKPPVYQSGRITPGHIATWTTDGVIQDGGAVSSGSSITPANPTATASDIAVNGSATTYMRSDAAPAVQKGSASQFGIVKADGTTITASGGVLTAVGGSGAGIVNVRDFGAIGQDRTYTNLVGGSGYTGGTAQLLTAQEDYTDASWTKNNVTITPNAVIDPRGNLLADAMVETTAATVRHDVISATFTGPGTFRFYVEVKPSVRTWVRISIADTAGTVIGLRTFNLSGDGAIGGKLERGDDTVTNQSITTAANGFYTLMLEVDHQSSEVVAVIQSLLGDPWRWDGNDQHDQYTSSGVTAFYLGRSQLCGVTQYQGQDWYPTNDVFQGVLLTGGAGNGQARALITVGMGEVLDVQSYCPGQGDIVGDTKSSANADIGGTGSGWSCQVATVGDDTVAIQDAIYFASANRLKLTVPSGTYNVFPQDTLNSNCLTFPEDFVGIEGEGRYNSIISCFVSGGRHPFINWDLQPTSPNQIIWRGNGFWLPFNTRGIEIKNLRLTGNCRRLNVLNPLADPDPGVINANSNPLGDLNKGNGWDLSHHAVALPSGPPKQGIRIIGCELDSWMGELIGGIGDFAQPISDPPSITAWSWWVEGCYIHDCNADLISVSGNSWIVNNELAWGTNANEFGGATTSHTVMCYNHVHDCGHGIVPVVNTEVSATEHCLGQQIIKDNLIERCPKSGIFVNLLQYNVTVDDNILVDCGGNIPASIIISLISGPNPHMNCFVRRNIMYNNTLQTKVGIGVNLGIFDAGTLDTVYIKDNIIALTPPALANGLTWEKGIDFAVNSGCSVEASDNDWRIATNHYGNSFAGGTVDQNHRNVHNESTNFSDVKVLTGNFDKASNTSLSTIGTGSLLINALEENISDSVAVWFEGMLFITAPAGGAKVAVVATGISVFAMRYDVEMWVGTTLDAASGQGTASGTVFASAAAITKVRISGFMSPNYAATGSIALQFAQNSSNITASSVLPGSWFKVRNVGN